MTTADYQTFRTELVGFAGILGRRIAEDTVRSYFRGLEDLDLDAVLRMLRRLARTVESGARMPTPAELRQRAGGTVTAPDQPLSPVALDRVRQAVVTALNAWEAADGDGTARPTFDAAWKAARRREGWGGTVQQREELWRDWLAGGLPLTAARQAELLAAARRRGRPGSPLFAMLERIREPGEDG